MRNNHVFITRPFILRLPDGTLTFIGAYVLPCVAEAVERCNAGLATEADHNALEPFAVIDADTVIDAPLTVRGRCSFDATIGMLDTTAL